MTYREYKEAVDREVSRLTRGTFTAVDLRYDWYAMFEDGAAPAAVALDACRRDQYARHLLD